MSTVQAAWPASSRARRSPFALVRQGIRDVWSRRRLVRYLVEADLTKKGSNTVLGNIWWILDPLLQMAVYVVFVSIIVNNKTDAYPLFIFCAILPWKWFNTSVSDGITSVTSQEKIIKQVQFPKLVLPVAAVVSGIVNFAFGMIPLAALLVLFYSSHISPYLVLIPVVAVVQFMFTLSVSIFLSAANVFFRDVGNMIRHLLRLWFYLSPALYGTAQLEKIAAKGGIIYTIFNLNPFASLFESYRNLIYYRTGPEWSGLAGVLVASFILTALAVVFFKRVEPSFAKVL